MKWIISPLDSSFDKSHFDCDNPHLNDFLRKYASQNLKKGYSLTFVATEPESKVIVGYYSASASSIEFANLPDFLMKNRKRFISSMVLFLC